MAARELRLDQANSLDINGLESTPKWKAKTKAKPKQNEFAI